MSAPRPFDRAAIVALGPAAAPPMRAADRTHSGKIRGVVIWTEPIKDRLRRAHAIGSIEGVIAAFPGWDLVALRCAIVRYIGASGAPVTFDAREFNERLARIPADQLLQQVHSLLLWSPLSSRREAAS
jgi:hypothetical protein